MDLFYVIGDYFVMFLYIHKGAEKVKPYGAGAHCGVEELFR